MIALPGDALLQLIEGATVLPALLYGGIVVLYLVVRKRLARRTGGFSLGRFELPVAFAALVWVGFAVFTLVTPPEAIVPNLIVLGLVLLGGVYFAKLLIVDRDVLENPNDLTDAMVNDLPAAAPNEKERPI